MLQTLTEQNALTKTSSHNVPLTKEFPTQDHTVTSTNTTVEPDKQQIEQALVAHSGVISRVAKALGLSRQALYRRMEKYGLSVNK